MENKTYLSAAALMWAAVWLLASGPAKTWRPEPVVPKQAQAVSAPAPAPEPVVTVAAVEPAAETPLVAEALSPVMAPGAPIAP